MHIRHARDGNAMGPDLSKHGFIVETASGATFWPLAGRAPFGALFGVFPECWPLGLLWAFCGPLLGLFEALHWCPKTVFPRGIRQTWPHMRDIVGDFATPFFKPWVLGLFRDPPRVCFEKMRLFREMCHPISQNHGFSAIFGTPCLRCTPHGQTHMAPLASPRPASHTSLLSSLFPPPSTQLPGKGTLRQVEEAGEGQLIPRLHVRKARKCDGASADARASTRAQPVVG